MRFDPDLAREILLQLEATPANRTPAAPAIEGRSEDEILEHVELLEEAGFIEAKIACSGSGQARIYTAFINHVTYSGHEFLAAARNQTLWVRAKEQVVTKGSAMTLDVLKGVLIGLAKNAVGLS